MGIKEIIEKELIKDENCKLIISNYGMNSNPSDESFIQTVRIESTNEEVYPDDFNRDILHEILKNWANEMVYRPVMVTESMRIYAIGENELMDTITIYYTDLGYYLVRAFSGQW